MPRLKTLVLEAFQDPEHGEIGLRVQGAPEGANAALDGLTIAHDIVEHVNGIKEIGSIDDELEALGAIWFARGQFADLRRNGTGSAHTPHQNIASDIVGMFRDHYYGAYVNLKPLQTQRLEEYDDDLERIIAEALKTTRAEIDDDADLNDVIAKERAYIATCLPRMRRGIRKARAKYKSARVANNLFWDIAEAVEPHAKHCEEGQQFILRYGLDARGCTAAECEECYGEDD